MKAWKFVLSTALFLPLSLNIARSEVTESVKKECMKAADFKGCVEVLSGISGSDDPNSQLREALKELSLALAASNLEVIEKQDINIDNIRKLADSSSFKDDVAVRIALKSELLFGALIDSYQNRKDAFHPDNNWGLPEVAYYCDPTLNGIKSFNRIVGVSVIEEFDKPYGLWGKEPVCYRSLVEKKEGEMRAFLAGLMREGAIPKEKVDKYATNREKTNRLRLMEPWQRHLKENPNLQAWAKANPKAALAAADKYNLKNNQNLELVPDYISQLQYAGKFNPQI